MAQYSLLSKYNMLKRKKKRKMLCKICPLQNEIKTSIFHDISLIKDRTLKVHSFILATLTKN